MDDASSTTDAVGIVSTVASVVSAFIAGITLFTVYIAALQLASQNRMYRLGLSWRAIGPWKQKVASSSYFGLRRKVSVPVVSISSLLSRVPNPDLEDGPNNVQAKASWVTFMQALGMDPESPPEEKDLYEMQDASELVNGVIPMPWEGKNLVAICSILGFQSHEKRPSYQNPMPLPMQWSGPLGWLQFRSSTNACVVEFRSRMSVSDQIPHDIHRYWQDFDMPQEPHFLHSRLWNAIGGLSLAGGRALYLGGADRDKGPRDMETETAKEERTQAKLFEDLTSEDLSSENILLKLYGKKKDRPKALQRDSNRSNPSQVERGANNPGRPGILDDLLREELGKLGNTCRMKELLRPCPGLLSVAINGELADSRGLEIHTCEEHDRKYVPDDEDIDAGLYPHHIGDLYMGKDLLKLVKDALLLLRPDGFYFSPTHPLMSDLMEAYGHIEQQSNKAMQIFPDCGNTTFPAEAIHLRSAMILCNNLQSTRKTSYAVFSVNDMRILAKASHSLKPIISGNRAASGDGRDLIWAILHRPDLSGRIRESLSLGNISISQFIQATVQCNDGVLDCSSIPGLGDPLVEKSAQFSIPLVGDGEYTGLQVLAALADVFITYYWINKRWITDVAVYDWTIPQSVTMC
ncbi:uncharacterized protein B0H64DRAFT_427505 [Chaetomium fimeti]|uniref:Uncharacterized protein n=1 Tax=Chaetomium fimeti TaxID=1854472 RepID=A0AAE0H7D1_9PEZI|nr:hypothetical protein B0H64DRAFT_427505 [Chaetomium fimeti]